MRFKNSRRRKGRIGKTIMRFGRYRGILTVLIRYGFSDLVRKVDNDAYRRLRGTRRVRGGWSRAERMRHVLEDLGPTFVKIGQLLSHRPDILPEDWIREFGKLRGAVKPDDSEHVRQLIIADLGAPPEEIFDDFDVEAIAAASIAQVHRAQISIDGARYQVAVKVQRTGIQPIMESDLAILKDFALLVERHMPSMANFNPVEAVRELERALLLELDFRNEADNLDTFRRNFSSDPYVTAPEPFRQFSSRRILTMSYLDGIPIRDPEELDAAGLDRSLIAVRGANAVMKQIFEDRFFHSDPHGNNILILPENNIAFLDFGQVGAVLPSQRLFLADLMAALIHLDAPRAVRAILAWSGYHDPDVDRRLTNDVEIIIESYLSKPFKQIDLGAMINALFEVIRRYSIEIPPAFYLLGKAVATIENVADILDPDFDFIRASRPFVRRMIRKELSPNQMKEHISASVGDAFRLVRDFPGEARDLMSLLKAGKLRTELSLKDMAKLDKTIRTMATRLSSAILLASMILASMILGSSLLVQSLIPPLIYGVPVIGILGFFASGLLGIVLLIDLWRHH